MVAQSGGNMKKAFAIYDSRIRQYRKDRKSTRSGNAKAGITAESTKVEEVDIDKLTEYALLQLDQNTCAPHPNQWNILGKTRQSWCQGQDGIAFDTKAEFRLVGSAGKAIEKKLRKLHTDVVKPHTNPDRRTATYTWIIFKFSLLVWPWHLVT